ncbi:nucleoprotein/polynucleotide-associated enzyme [Agarivorans albus MKT 106]|uniref:Nucleoprotein/polynucleotide-associated enzyme n=1 Tax=Agarivorans albus MKT 106 TaxID=1331007 RepID=R9PFG4_AGAAL|nr:nucleoprotein/polynucleotide-associated enzyme [Agarivorans albus MKT 106]
MAKLSLQEQMLKAGLVDKKKAKKVGKTNKKLTHLGQRSKSSCRASQA